MQEDEKAAFGIVINTGETGRLIPAGFSGLSIETGSLRKGNGGYVNYGGHLFSDDNAQMLQIFETLGIRHLRVGGGSVDMNNIEPSYEDIDHLFAFARKSGVKVVYSFRLLNGDSRHNVEIAKYIWDKYSDLIDCFAVGNEPDWDSYHKVDREITDYVSYRDKWLRFADDIKAVVPEAMFTGPDTGSNYPVTGAKDTDHNGKSWTVNFAEDLKGTGLLKNLSTHNYVGQDVAGQNLNPSQMVNKMLSRTWVNREYPELFHAIAKPALESGFSCRLSESNSFSSGCDGGSNCFATALFALDYMHWWAERQCDGVNFHNKQWVLNAPISMDAGTGNLVVNPVGYGIAAFGIGGNGYVQPISIDNERNANVTAYAVKNDNAIYITVINKEYGYNAREVEVSIDIDKEVIGSRTLSLESPDNLPLSMKAVLGGAVINSSEPWNGEWRQSENLCFTVSPSSALIVEVRINNN